MSTAGPLCPLTLGERVNDVVQRMRDGEEDSAIDDDQQDKMTPSPPHTSGRVL